jgi:hypothetical protein
MRLTLLVICIAVALALLCSTLTCAERRGAVPATQRVQGEEMEYESRSGHFSLRYPSDWSSRPTKDYTLLLERASPEAGARVTVDLPYIPPHLPGMMTMKLVVNGYVDDLKTQLSDFTVVERADATLAGAPAQRLLMTGRERAADRRGEQRTIWALVAIRDEQVYILQADATPEQIEAARSTIAAIVAGWKWNN